VVHPSRKRDIWYGSMGRSHNDLEDLVGVLFRWQKKQQTNKRAWRDAITLWKGRGTCRKSLTAKATPFFRNRRCTRHGWQRIGINSSRDALCPRRNHRVLAEKQRGNVDCKRLDAKTTADLNLPFPFRKSHQKGYLKGEDTSPLFAEFPSITLCRMNWGHFGQLSERVSA
jgi:hypothetical protein